MTSKKLSRRVLKCFIILGKPVIIEGYDFLPEIYIKLISSTRNEINEQEKQEKYDMIQKYINNELQLKIKAKYI